MTAPDWDQTPTHLGAGVTLFPAWASLRLSVVLRRELRGISAVNGGGALDREMRAIESTLQAAVVALGSVPACAREDANPRPLSRDELMTSDEVADALGVTAGQARRLRRAGAFGEPQPFGRELLVRRDAVQAYANERNT